MTQNGGDDKCISKSGLPSIHLSFFFLNGVFLFPQNSKQPGFLKATETENELCATAIHKVNSTYSSLCCQTAILRSVIISLRWSRLVWIECYRNMSKNTDTRYHLRTSSSIIPKSMSFRLNALNKVWSSRYFHMLCKKNAISYTQCEELG